MHGTPDTETEAAAWHPGHARTADYSGRSNLALAFLCLPREKRADMNVFYTFCRLVDDIADSPSLPPEEKDGPTERLARCDPRSLASSAGANSHQTAARLADEVHSLIGKYQLPPETFSGGHRRGGDGHHQPAIRDL